MLGRILGTIVSTPVRILGEVVRVPERILVDDDDTAESIVGTAEGIREDITDMFDE